MANNKTFKIKNGLQAGRYLGSNGNGTTGADGPDGLFSTDLYTGNNTTQTIDNGIDLSGEGGLMWNKARNNAYDNYLFDTESGVGKYLSSNNTNQQFSFGGSFGLYPNTSGTGFVVNGSGNGYNDGDTPTNYASWTFRKASKFFDIVTYTGDGAAGRTVSHNLGSVPGMIIVKKTSAGGDYWNVFHRSIGETKALYLNATDAQATGSGFWNNTAPTSTVFSLGASGEVNGSGASYVAYIFAHDTASDSNIKCGSFVPSLTWQSVIDIGFEPQWIMYKKATGTGEWNIVDSVRGVVSGAADPLLTANSSAAEVGYVDSFSLHANGFEQTFSSVDTNTYIYMAIRDVSPKQTLDLSTGHTFSFTPAEALNIIFSNPPASGTAVGFTLEVNNTGGYALTWPSSVKWHLGTAPTATASKELYTFVTTDGGTTYYGKLAGSNIA